MTPSDKLTSNARNASRNTALLFAGTLTKMLGSFLFVLLCADRLGVEGFGQYSIAIHYFELFLSLSATAAGIMLTRDIARWPKRTAETMAASFALCLALCLAAPVLMFAFAKIFHYTDATMTATLISCLALPPAALSYVCEAVFVAKHRAEFVTKGTVIESLIRITLSVTLLLMGFGLFALVAAFIVSRTVLFAVYCAGLREIDALHLSWNYRSAKRFALRWRVFAAENWMATLYQSLDVIILSWIAGEYAAGLYSAACKVVRLGCVVAKSYTTAVFPIMSRLHSESKTALTGIYMHSIRGMANIALPAILVIFVMPDRIIDLLFNDEYAAAATVLQILIWSLLIEFLNPFLSHVLFARKQQHRSMQVAAISLAVNLVATYLLVKAWGAAGAAAGTILGGLVATLCFIYFAIPLREIPLLIAHMSRALLAGLLLACLTWMLTSAPLVLVVATVCLAYLPALLLVGAAKIDDFIFVRRTLLARGAS